MRIRVFVYICMEFMKSALKTSITRYIEDIGNYVLLGTFTLRASSCSDDAVSKQTAVYEVPQCTMGTQSVYFVDAQAFLSLKQEVC